MCNTIHRLKEEAKASCIGFSLETVRLFPKAHHELNHLREEGGEESQKFKKVLKKINLPKTGKMKKEVESAAVKGKSRK